MSEHIKLPLSFYARNVGIADTGDYDGVVEIKDADGKVIFQNWNGDDFDEERARHIVACVNACAGFANPEKDIPAIETASKMHFDQAMANGQRASEYEAQRDELLAAAKKMRPFIEEGEVPQCFWSEPFKSALAEFDAAIEKAK